MKILIHIPQLIYGGAEKVLVPFANYLISKGHEVEVLETYERGLLKNQFDKKVTFNSICSNEYTKKYYASLQDIKAERNIFKKLGLCFKKLFSTVVGYQKFATKLAAKHYKNTKFDIAINYLESEPPTFILENIKATKYMQWFHTDVAGMSDPSEIDSYSIYFARVDVIVCVSAGAKENFCKRYPALAAKTRLIYNFYDKKQIVTASIPPYKFDTQKPVLLSVGRMTEQKAYPRFLKVLKRLKDDGFEFSYHIIGTGGEFDLIKQTISDLELSDRVVLRGLTDNPYQYMAGCDLFVLPSIWEAFPTVTVEAKLLNLPVLATDVSGIREQTVHDRSAWIVDNNEDAIYEGMKYLLSNKTELNRLRSNAGILKICDNTEKYDRFLSAFYHQRMETPKE